MQQDFLSCGVFVCIYAKMLATKHNLARLLYDRSLFKSLANLKHSIQQRQLNETTGSRACTLPNEVRLYIRYKSKFTASN